MPDMKTYDPKKVSIIVGPHVVTGYADGTFVEIERMADSFALYVGADGEATRAKSNNKSGTIKLTLQQSSFSNDYLSGLCALDEASNSGIVPALIRDSSGRSLFAAEKAYIQKPAVAGFGKETETREWTIVTNALVPFAGGN